MLRGSVNCLHLSPACACVCMMRVCVCAFRARLQFDKDASGTVDHDEFRQQLAALGFNLSDFEFDKFVSKYDPKNLGEINYRQFQAAIGNIIQPDVVNERNLKKELVRPPLPSFISWWRQRLTSVAASELEEGFRDVARLEDGALPLPHTVPWG